MSDDNSKKGPCVPCMAAMAAAAAVHEVTKEVVDRAGEAADAEKGGPSKYNSTAYRNGWENIFGQKQSVGQA